jgi:hypothetical protein
MIEAWLAPLLLAVTAAAPPAAPPEAQDLPARAPDHVVRMEGGPQCPDCEPYRRTVVRSGPWVREEGLGFNIHQIHYSDFESNTSFSVVRGLDDGFQWITVQRDTEALAPYRLHRRRQGSNASWLGEPCERWSMNSTIYDGDSCETPDGVQLWTRQLRGDGSIMSSSQAVSVERRPVRRDEAQVPADFFGQLPPPRAGAAEDAAAFEVRFVFGRGRDRVEELYRQSGTARFSRRRSADNRVTFEAVDEWVTDEGIDERVTFTYDVGADGRPVRLNTAYNRRPDRSGRGETWEPVPGRRWRLLYGERCRWQRRTEGERGGESHHCRTASGIPLMIEFRPDDREPIIYRAASLRRGPLESGAFAIPAEASDWANWGVVPAPAR